MDQQMTKLTAAEEQRQMKQSVPLCLLGVDVQSAYCLWTWRQQQQQRTHHTTQWPHPHDTRHNRATAQTRLQGSSGLTTPTECCLTLPSLGRAVAGS
jgi:hypothetical protein